MVFLMPALSAGGTCNDNILESFNPTDGAI